MQLDPFRFVKFYAATKHGGRQYRVGLPYTHHLAEVASVLVEFGCTSQEMIEAAWLHDVLEDTDTKKKEIEEMFGTDVADIVFAVTDEPGQNRKIRKALTYPKIRKDPRAVQLKLADRIANVRGGGKFTEMYKSEYEDFKRNLYTKGQFEDMWAALDALLST